MKTNKRKKKKINKTSKENKQILVQIKCIISNYNKK